MVAVRDLKYPLLGGAPAHFSPTSEETDWAALSLLSIAAAFSIIAQEALDLAQLDPA